MPCRPWQTAKAPHGCAPVVRFCTSNCYTDVYEGAETAVPLQVLATVNPTKPRGRCQGVSPAYNHAMYPVTRLARSNYKILLNYFKKYIIIVLKGRSGATLDNRQQSVLCGAKNGVSGLYTP